jgi:hypothetical protein
VTAIPADPRITELRELFRYLSEFRLTHELTGLEEVTSREGNTWSLWDLEYLLAATDRLNLRQRQAITLCLVHGVKESDAAEMMGVSRSNPVMMYATLGLRRLLDMVDYGELDRFDKPVLKPEDEVTRCQAQLAELAKLVRSKLVEVSDCALFPNRGGHEPRLLLRSPTTYTGYRIVSPMQVLWLDEIGPIPDGCSVSHSARVPRVAISCSKPQHGELLMSHAYKVRLQRAADAYNARRRAQKTRLQQLAEEYIQSLGRSA